MNEQNQQIIVKRFPQGWVQESDFELIQTALPDLKSGQVLVRNQWLSLDPYMRGRLSSAKSYAQSAKIGEVMVGQTAGVVIASKSSEFQQGETVLTYSGWQTHCAAEASNLKRIDASKLSSSAYLGILGMPGVTAWMGLMDLCEPKKGDTVLVDAASGAVGSIVGQLAKNLGCRVVGIAGGQKKCDYVVNDLDFDACVDHTHSKFKEHLQVAVPQGIDCVFENVGGAVFEAILTHMNPFSRIALCGLVSEYNVPPYANQQLRSILVNRIRIQGFIVTDRPQAWPTIIESLTQKVLSGDLKYKESIAHGIEKAPRAFIGMLKGENLGKQLVQLF